MDSSFSGIDQETVDGLVAAAAAGLMIAAAASDIARFRIPNALVAALVLLFALAALAGLVPHPHSHVAVGTTLLAAGFVLFAAGWFGAGDGKFLAACGLFAGPAGVVPLLTVTALAGGVMAVVAVAWRLVPAGSGLTRPAAATLRSQRLPYGVAIAAGGIAALLPAFMP